MADYHGFLRDYRERSAPGEPRLAAIRARLSAPRRRAWPLLVPLALAAAAVFALHTPSATDVPLGAGAPPGPVALTDAVRVDARGEGAAHLAGETIGVAWRRGTLALDVEPGRGVDLVVTTDEGTVRVVGTAFTVTRDALGTTVAVSRGRVETDCAFGGPSPLSAGGTRTCLPRTAAGALGRVHALEDGGAAPAALLAETESALARPDAGGAVANELGAVRVGALLALDRPGDALLAAERTLQDAPGSRDPELRRVAARLHVTRGDCAAALPHLAALVAADALGPDAVLLTRCAPEPR
jgi:ferric-dicitrate binding protein FerR (iron transport regulator)